MLDLNADMGESYGRWLLGDDAGVMHHVTVVNIASGFHAGDPSTIRETVGLAVELGLQIGAHVSLPDMIGFGRRRMAISARSSRTTRCTRSARCRRSRRRRADRSST